MRATVGVLAGVLAAALLAACTEAPPTTPATDLAAQPTPSVAVTSGSAAPSTTPAASAEPAQPTQAETDTEPRGEVPLSLPPVEKPQPQGGPWDQLGVKISDAEQVGAGAGVPESFLAYAQARLAYEDDAGCTPTSFELTAAHRDGFVYGAEESPCDASFAVWGIDEGEWRYLIHFQDPPQCVQLTELGIPVDAPGLTCEDDVFQVRNY